MRLSKELDLREKELQKVEERNSAFILRKTELEKAMEEAQTDEDLVLIDEEIEKLEEEGKEISEEKENLEEKISVINEELDQLEEKEDGAAKAQEERKNMDIKTPEVRKGFLESEEEKVFYRSLNDALLSKRALSNTDLVIPEVVINRIESNIPGYSNLMNEVDVISLTGNGRVLTAGDIPTAVWMECCDPVSELADAFEQIELDCYKVGGYIPVCNATLEDSFINLASLIEERMAKSIAKAIDIAIMVGDGVKKPLGVLKNATEGESVETVAELLAKSALVDSEGEIIITANNKTLMGVIYPQLLLPTADGKYVYDGSNLAGFRFVRADALADSQLVIGDFKKYALGMRKNIEVSTSTDVRFIEDQTVIKAVARADGKPKNNAAFVKVTITPKTQAKTTK